MDEKKHCLRCNRLIDASARLCPYCNLDQSSTAGTVPRAEKIAPLPPPPIVKSRGEGRAWTKRALIAVGVVALLIGTFVIGGLVIGRGKRAEQASEDPAVSSTISSQSAQEPVTDLTLVPFSEGSSTIGRSMTSVPPPSSDSKVPEELQRSDATALPSTEYSRIVQERRVAAPKPKEVVVDPRTVTKPAEERSAASSLPRTQPSRDPIDERNESEPRQDRTPEERPSTISRDGIYTKPVPTYQPLPRIKDRSKEIKRDGTISMRLTIGADGRVKEVQVLESLPGVTDKVIAAVQQWKFKPATRNGMPVEGIFPVDISFKSGNDEND